MPSTEIQSERRRLERERGMKAARAWRDDSLRLHFVAVCHRCNNEGIIRTWFGRIGEGGRVGPCPNCQRPGAQRFAQAFNREVWGDAEDHRARRARSFHTAFTQGGNEDERRTE